MNAYLVLRDRVLDMIKSTPDAASSDELAEMQGQVDDVLRETLDCCEDGAIEDVALLAFGRVLKHFHFAVSGRRAVPAARS